MKTANNRLEMDALKHARPSSITLKVMKTKMNKWKWAFFICLAVLLLSGLFFVYSAIDQSVSYTYLEVSYDDQVAANKVLGNLIVQGGKEYSQKDFLHLLRQAYPQEFIVEEGNMIIMGHNQFKFENDRLISAK